MAARDERFVDDFDAPTLDEAVWLPHYLPAWSSRAATAASFRLGHSRLTLDIPVDHPIWCAGDHHPPIRVSGIQSGNFSGPVGSERGQQPFRDRQRVVEEQDRFEGWLPTGGHVEVRARLSLSPRSMASAWLVGFEDEPTRCGEICIIEVFGRSIRPAPAEPSAELGMGLHAFRDPGLVEDFQAPRLDLDVTEFHTYAVDWDTSVAVFAVDGQPVRQSERPPTYPMQLMIAVFDFPEWSTGTDELLVPELVIDWVRGG
jgi:hypothetical protein